VRCRRRLVSILVALTGGLAVPAAAHADVSIYDSQVTEGNGATTMTFGVVRTGSLLSRDTTVSFVTKDGSATAPSDYVATQGSLTFKGALLPVTQTQTITITIVGDVTPEPTENFSVVLTGATNNEVLVDPTAIGTILNDDIAAPPGPPGRDISLTTIQQQLISRASNGDIPNAAVHEPTISGDGRIARYVAYESAATNIAAPTDGHHNIFLVKRGGSPGKFGTPWEYGSTVLASPGRGGAAANGDSSSPSLGGWTKGDTAKKPTCLGFVSEASNLVAGDSNGHADGFLRKLPSGKIRRVKTPAAASEIAVSGDCKTTAVVAGGSLFIKRGKKKLRKLVSGGVSSPDLTFNGLQVGYGQSGKVRVRRVGGGATKGVAVGANPSADGGRPKGKIRRVVYERASMAFIAKVGGGEKLMSPGALPAMSAGGTQAMFAYGPYAYLYAVSNSFGKAKPQGVCPLLAGFINGLSMSGRGNYAVFSCSGGPAYLSFLGGK
jgi:Calx-beta domain